MKYNKFTVMKCDNSTIIKYKKSFILYVYFCETKKAKLIILILNYETLLLFLMMLLCNLTKIKLIL